MYATAADFIAAFPDDESVELTNLDTPSAVAPVLARIETALSEAESEINTYVGMVATLPLTSVPVVLKNAAIRIARYRLDSYNPREFVRLDYEDQVKFLKLVAERKVTLGLDSESTPVESERSSSGIAYRAQPRVFTRESMRGYGGWQ
jgi:phage gp36-like protein